MLCFAIACKNSASDACDAASKLFWHRVCRDGDLRTPQIIAVCDEDGIIHRHSEDASRGISKPMNGMYGNDVESTSFDAFCKRARRDHILVEEIAANPPCLSYRLCTFKTARGTRVISLFVMSLSQPTQIPWERWNKLKNFGAKLCQVHSRALQFAPLVGWDLIVDENDGRIFVLEGNLGGAVGMHLIPFPTKLGVVREELATRWLAELGEAVSKNIYSRCGCVE